MTAYDDAKKELHDAIKQMEEALKLAPIIIGASSVGPVASARRLVAAAHVYLTIT